MDGWIHSTWTWTFVPTRLFVWGNIGYKWRMKNPRMTNGDKKDKLKA